MMGNTMNNHECYFITNGVLEDLPCLIIDKIIDPFPVPSTCMR